MGKRQSEGFTIVELLIVVVVIAILAAITIVSYNGIQARASDSKIRTMATQLQKAVMLWNIDTGLAPRNGYGSAVAFNGTECVDGSGGWITQGSYVCALEDLLLSKNLVPVNFIRSAPINKEYGLTSAHTFMFYRCGATTSYALFYYLQSPSTEDTASITSAESLGCGTGPRTNYKMKAAKIMVMDA